MTSQRIITIIIILLLTKMCFQPYYCRILHLTLMEIHGTIVTRVTILMSFQPYSQERLSEPRWQWQEMSLNDTDFIQLLFKDYPCHSGEYLRKGFKFRCLSNSFCILMAAAAAAAACTVPLPALPASHIPNRVFTAHEIRDSVVLYHHEVGRAWQWIKPSATVVMTVDLALSEMS